MRNLAFAVGMLALAACGDGGHYSGLAATLDTSGQVSPMPAIAQGDASIDLAANGGGWDVTITAPSVLSAPCTLRGVPAGTSGLEFSLSGSCSGLGAASSGGMVFIRNGAEVRDPWDRPLPWRASLRAEVAFPGAVGLWFAAAR